MARHRPWEPEETEYLRANFGVLTIDEIAAHLGRSFHAVTSHAAYKNIRSQKPRRAEPIALASWEEPPKAKLPPAPTHYRRRKYDPTPCSERELGYVG